ncbi:MAG: hypothetical protein FJW40_16155 [Acidobacteria bacterium]|nr:hypothetical protein [Acidobacteriota bacterium]
MLSMAAATGRSRHVRHTGWLAAANAITAGAQWVWLPATARLAGPTITGEMALGQAVAVPLMMFAGLQLRALVSTDPARSFRLAEYMNARRITFLAAILLLMAAGWAAAPGSLWVPMALLFAVHKAFEGLAEIHHGGWLRAGDAASGAFCAMGRSLGSAAVFLAVLAGTANPAAAMSWSLLPSVALLVLVENPKGARRRPPQENAVRWAKVLELLHQASPLGLAVLLVSLTAYIPRYVAGEWVGMANLGALAALGTLVMAASLGVNALGQALAVDLARAAADRDEAAFQNHLLRGLALAVAAGLAVFLTAVLAEDWLLSLFGSGFGQHKGLLVWLAAAAIPLHGASMLGYALTARRILQPQVWLLAATALAALLASFALIPAAGLPGAAAAQAAAGITQLAGAAWLLRRNRETL